MQVPYTPGGKLRAMLTKMEEGLAFKGRVRYAEDLGSTLEGILATDPWRELGCNRPDCFPCKTSKGKCWDQSITYSIECNTCKARGKNTKYFGESGRTGHDRGKDHVLAISKGDTKNACAKHQMEHHQGEPWDFGMRVLRSHIFL